MVTKLLLAPPLELGGLILAKFHMVTKRASKNNRASTGLILAKFHMVTKRALERV